MRLGKQLAMRYKASRIYYTATFNISHDRIKLLKVVDYNPGQLLAGLYPFASASALI